jgi:hypothetical protein
VASGRTAGFDPRKEKRLNFRHQGKSCSSRSCVWCRWDRMHRGSERRARKREAQRVADATSRAIREGGDGA